MGAISALTCANRVEIFRHLAVDVGGDVDLNLLDSIACDHYHRFLEFCDQVFAEKDRIEEISCALDEGKNPQFHIQYQS